MPRGWTGKRPPTRLRGLCATTDDTNPIWNIVSWKDSGSDAQTVGYGDFTGATFPVGQGVLSSQRPRYIIEALVDKEAGQRADKTGGNDNDLSPAYIFRITAVGWGHMAAHRSCFSPITGKATLRIDGWSIVTKRLGHY